MSEATPERPHVGRVIVRTFSAAGAGIFPFMVLALVFAVLPDFVISFGVNYLRLQSAAGTDPSTFALFSIVGDVVASVPAYVAMGAIAHGALARFAGRRASLGSCFAAGVRWMPGLLATGAVTNVFLAVAVLIVVALSLAGGVVAFVFAGLLLFVPAIWVVAVLCLSAPAMVAERLGPVPAFRRSVALTNGARFRIFWLVAIALVIVILLSAVAGLVQAGIWAAVRSEAFAQYVGGPMGWAIRIVGFITNALGTVIISCGLAALYEEARRLKEGPRKDELGEVFE